MNGLPLVPENSTKSICVGEANKADKGCAQSEGGKR